MSEHILTNAELAILSLISEKPRHGYEIEGVIEERGMRDWTDVAFSSIYFILNRLMKKGLAASSLQPASGRGPAKKVFHSTDEGHKALHDGILQAIVTEDRSGKSFLLALACLPMLTKVEIEEAFTRRFARLTAKIDELSQHPTLVFPGMPLHVRAMFEYSINQIQAELAWSQKFLKSYLAGEQHGKT